MVYDPLETIRMKDAEKHLVDYADTEFTIKARRNLAEINEATRAADIGLWLGPNLAALGESTYEFLNDDGKVFRFNFRQDQYHRVFNNKCWTLGGRFYGPTWQSIPKAVREYITINGEPTVELDYPTLHPRLLYAQVGKSLDSDAYSIEGFERSIVKVAFNVMVNADTDRAALSAIAKAIGGEGAFAKAKDLMETVKVRHASVAEFFCTGAGRWLQRSDSNMAEGVMLSAVHCGIVALGVHDSFIIQERHEDRILEFMNEQLEREKRRLNPHASPIT